MSASTTSSAKRKPGRARKASPAAPAAAVKTAPAFIFTGDPVNGQDPERITLLGYEFALNGEPVEVSDALASRLDGHSHFKRA